MSPQLVSPNNQCPPLSEAASITEGWAAIAGTAVQFTCELPELINSETPRVLIVPGLLLEQEHYSKLRGAVARLGAIAVTYDQPTKQDLATSVHPDHWNVMKLQSQVPWAVMKAVNQMPELRIDPPAPSPQYFLAGHSMGAYIATRLANTKTEHIEGVVLIAGAGMQKHNILKMGARTLQFGAQEVLPAATEKFVENPPKFIKDTANYGKRILGSLPRKVREVTAVATCDNRPNLIPLMPNGVGVRMVAFRGDHYSTVSENKAVSEILGAELQVMDGDHLSPLHDPESVASSVIDAVYALRAVGTPRRRPDLHLVA